MIRAVDGIVIVGPPGSGKSHLGRLLKQRGLTHFVDLEPELLACFGKGQEFAARKTEALEFLRLRYLEQLTSSELPVMFQSTGLSDRGILIDLAAAYRLVFAKLETPRAVCIERVITRPQDQNINNDPGFTASFYDYWTEAIAPSWEFDLQLDGQDAELAVRQVSEALSIGVVPIN
jgi:hypothetical protein